MQDPHTAAHSGDTPGQTSPLRLAATAALGLPAQLAGRVDSHLAAFVQHMTQGLLAAWTAVGLEVLAELMDAEVAEVAGPNGKHDPARVAKRHGSDQAIITLGGRRVPIRRPRVRSVSADEHERALAYYQTVAATDLLAEGIVARMLAGGSTRRYPTGPAPVGEQVDQQATGTLGVGGVAPAGGRNRRAAGLAAGTPAGPIPLAGGVPGRVRHGRVPAGRCAGVTDGRASPRKGTTLTGWSGPVRAS
jgi:hypothetical protein